MSAQPPTATPPPSPPQRHERRSPLRSRGEPMIWLTGTALTLSVVMVVGLLAIVLFQGLGTFWQRPLHSVVTVTGETFLGVPVREERYKVEPARFGEVSVRDNLHPRAVVGGDSLRRRLYQVGNKEFTGQPFRWVDLADLAEVAEPDLAVFVERTDWGPWLGHPEALLTVEQSWVDQPSDQVELEGRVPTDRGERRCSRRVLREDNGRTLVEETVFLAEGREETWVLFRELHPDAAERRQRIEKLNRRDVGDVNYALEKARLRLRLAQLEREEGKISDEALQRAQRRHDEREAELNDKFAEIQERVREIRAEDDRYRVHFVDPNTGRFAPTAQTTPDSPMRLSQVVRAVAANTLDTSGKLGVYFSRWREFITAPPRNANTEGGVWPVIFGTVMMTLLLCVIVVPIGVVAALYLYEYAKQGLVVSAVRIAVNNLAGVPSIVYGVFGLGFFCYTVGKYVDEGPANPWSPGMWWLGMGALVVILFGAVTLGLAGRGKPGAAPVGKKKWLARAAVLLWLGAGATFVALLVTTPYFQGFFRAKLPSPTFGTKGILWSSLTLALLTLPVVIVATEEALSAVPKSMREGSYGCGASKWQTIQRIVLPRAAPGIMTGMILAMARGAGEVAPLMLVGAVKLAPELPFDHHFPYFHLERSFMHLGFHIYDVGFQSPDSEAARPVVWTTTLLLIAIVVMLNLSAIRLRTRLRRKFVSEAF